MRCSSCSRRCTAARHAGAPLARAQPLPVPSGRMPSADPSLEPLAALIETEERVEETRPRCRRRRRRGRGAADAREARARSRRSRRGSSTRRRARRGAARDRRGRRARCHGEPSDSRRRRCPRSQPRFLAPRALSASCHLAAAQSDGLQRRVALAAAQQSSVRGSDSSIRRNDRIVQIGCALVIAFSLAELLTYRIRPGSRHLRDGRARDPRRENAVPRRVGLQAAGHLRRLRAHPRALRLRSARRSASSRRRGSSGWRWRW